MRKITFIILAFFLVSLVSAQTFKKVNLPKKQVNCYTVKKKGDVATAPVQTTKEVTANLNETFDVAAFPPTGWSVEGLWWYNSAHATAAPFAAAAQATSGFAFYGAAEADAGDMASLITPVLHPVAGNNTLSYKVNLYQYYQIGYASTGALMYIEFSTNGTTWTTSTTNVLAPLPTYNTASSGWQTLTADLSAYNGQAVQVRFRTVSDWGAFQLGLDDVTGPEADITLSTNDIMVSRVYADFSGMDYYALTPISQIGPINFGAAVSNLGAAAQTSIALDADLNNGAFTTNIGTNNPLASLASGASDTLWAELTGLTAAMPTEFGVNITATQAQTDENADDNSDSIYFSVDTTNYLRGGNITSVLTSYSFGTSLPAATGFEFGAEYHFINNGVVDGITAILYGKGGNATLTGHLYSVNLTTGDRTEVATTANYTPTTSYGTIDPVFVPFTTPFTVVPPAVLTATIEMNITVGTDTIYLLGDGQYLGSGYGLSAVYAPLSGTWSWLVLTNTMPLVGLSVDNSTGVKEVNTSDVVAYPNPTTGILNIANAENAVVSVFNMLGQQVINVSNVKSIDMSSLPAGSYFVKIQTNDNVVTKRINLVK
ncbi:MAG: hypothetical protein A2309_07780 [Bacteroidetes bacterium RIFOXYB2_FULL_35_7]|nr:MAG: hypothetical protein A2X01_14360 [Bacteroidetes bacterium GWF2_35_48]OFY92324.1 MAG: hypothetical protein A2309_07780 [Bacteroidetes bacterium RIFOXYB2_FULL_35_7]OFY93171.1 MAG: hypothetical protein A2491_14485 [Bacteroidetes bacterium RIFOXYC12_FULL_35_7]HBX52293.1 hypothetical protein [Bacteroidales bacterium]